MFFPIPVVLIVALLILQNDTFALPAKFNVRKTHLPDTKEEKGIKNLAQRLNRHYSDQKDTT